MAVGQEPTQSGQARIYIKQQPENVTLNGNVIITEEVTDVGGLQSNFGLNAFNGVMQPGLVSFGIAPGAANHCVVTITIQDNGGQVITGTPFDLDVILSDAATGVGLTAVTASGGVAVTTGTLLNTYTASKAFYIQSNGSGVLVLNITDTAKTGFFVMVQGSALPIPYVSRQLVTGDYG